jgi:hypothetical protein
MNMRPIRLPIGPTVSKRRVSPLQNPMITREQGVAQRALLARHHLQRMPPPRVGRCIILFRHQHPASRPKFSQSRPRNLRGGFDGQSVARKKLQDLSGGILVPRAGLEPACPYGRRILSPLRLPFRHLGTRVRASSCHRFCQSEALSLKRCRFAARRRLTAKSRRPSASAGNLCYRRGLADHNPCIFRVRIELRQQAGAGVAPVGAATVRSR